MELLDERKIATSSAYTRMCPFATHIVSLSSCLSFDLSMDTLYTRYYAQELGHKRKETWNFVLCKFHREFSNIL